MWKKKDTTLYFWAIITEKLNLVILNSLKNFIYCNFLRTLEVQISKYRTLKKNKNKNKGYPSYVLTLNYTLQTIIAGNIPLQFDLIWTY